MTTTGSPMPLGKALDGARFSRLHRKFWLLAALGIMLDGFDFFIIGVANPLIAQEFDATAWQTGLVSSAAIVGAIFGAAFLGPLGDKLGRRRIFHYDLVMFAVFSIGCMVAWDLWSLIGFRFLLGIAIGLDYPIAASYLAEILPAKNRGRWLVSAFALQAVGMLLGALVGVVVLLVLPDVSSWRWMLGFGVIPALIIVWLRRSTPESPRWLAQNGQEAQACEIASALAARPVVVTPADTARREEQAPGIKALVQPQLFAKGMRRRTVFTAVPWFLMDIATYGVGIFTPTLLAAFALTGANSTFLADDIAATEGTAVLDIFLVLGFITAILTVERLGRIRLQIVGFAAMAIGLVVLGTAAMLPGGGDDHLWLVFLGFALFNFFMNAGPNATTYALPAEVFPSEVRAAGHGFAAGAAKLGAAIGVFFFPIVLKDIGEGPLLFGLAVTCLVALAITAALRIEPRGRSLDDLAG
ncbi:MAG: MFS transporter [Actinobacteria bacterium]|nr:MFS transporter [Actinomycetota bacterium]